MRSHGNEKSPVLHVVVITVGVRSASGDICEGEEREEGGSCALNGVGVSTVSYPSPERQTAATERLRSTHHYSREPLPSPTLSSFL